VDLSDKAARELHEDRIPLIGGVGSDQNFYPGSFGLSEGIREVRHLIAGHLPTVGIGKMTTRYEHGQLAEVRFDPDSPIVSFGRPISTPGACASSETTLLLEKDRKLRTNAATLAYDRSVLQAAPDHSGKSRPKLENSENTAQEETQLIQ
jgi:hypothetical protein